MAKSRELLLWEASDPARRSWDHRQHCPVLRDQHDLTKAQSWQSSWLWWGQAWYFIQILHILASSSPVPASVITASGKQVPSWAGNGPCVSCCRSSPCPKHLSMTKEDLDSADELCKVKQWWAVGIYRWSLNGGAALIKSVRLLAGLVVNTLMLNCRQVSKGQ